MGLFMIRIEFGGQILLEVFRLLNTAVKTPMHSAHHTHRDGMKAHSTKAL